MNGPGCYGAVILRIIAGSGYTLYWSNKVHGLYEDDSLENNFPLAAAATSQKACGCASGSNPNTVREMVSKLNRLIISSNS